MRLLGMLRKSCRVHLLPRSHAPASQACQPGMTVLVNHADETLREWSTCTAGMLRSLVEVR